MLTQSNRDASKNPKTVCKMRGITLNYSASQVVNLYVIRDKILKVEPELVKVHTNKMIKR
jgi:hypothetical protein